MTMAASFLPLEQAIGNLVPLRNMPATQRAQVLKSAQVVEYPKGVFIFRQGERDGYAYFLLAGTLEMYRDNQLVQEVTGGTAAAAHALAQLQPRQFSARATTPVSLLRADRALMDQTSHCLTDQGGLLEVREIDQASQDSDWMTRLLRSELFARIPAANIQRIFRQLEGIPAHAGDVILRQGEPGNHYYILREGRCMVSRTPGQKGPAVQLAELHPGDSFGEEALVANAKRNATVTMLTDGELMRLTKEDFIELIRTPLLRQIDFAEAQRKSAQGAQWLDVRNAAEFAKASLPQSFNIPLSMLRLQHQKLARNATYIVVCDDGARSAAAAFLLAERGYDVMHLRGGLNASGALKSAPQTAETAAANQGANVLSFPPPINKPPVPASQRTESELDSIMPAAAKETAAAQLDADVRVSTLHAELMEVNLRLQEALRLKDDAELARLEFEKRIAMELQAERDRLHTEEERARQALAETARLKEELEAAKHKAEAEALRLRQEEDQRLEQLRAEADRRLQEEKQKLETAYAWKEEELTRVLREKQEAETQLAEERRQLADEKLKARQRLQEARHLQEQLEELQKINAEEIATRLQQQEELESKLRDEIKMKINAERHQLETEFARNARLLEQAQLEREAAEAARQAAAEEAERIVAEYRVAHERWKTEEQARLAAERQHLESEALQLEENLAAAVNARAEAEAARLAAETHLQALRAISPNGADVTAATSAQWQSEVRKAEHSISEASKHVQVALQAEEAAAAAIEENQVELTRQEEAESALHLEIQQDIDGWLREQEDLENSDIQRMILANQRENMERIKRSAEAARKAVQEHDQQLLDDLAKRLCPVGRTPS
ncbi:MAG TPA: cyclic nucleotide-binding domain-containing protein [Gammaproteobacteria bacterium]|nr:cyclic nucleotide-binding domain-containing protein [Gammaproteobacteria bacterium]